jgi:hypothetical protein
MTEFPENVYLQISVLSPKSPNSNISISSPYANKIHLSLSPVSFRFQATSGAFLSERAISASDPKLKLVW